MRREVSHKKEHFMLFIPTIICSKESTLASTASAMEDKCWFELLNIKFSGYNESMIKVKRGNYEARVIS